MKKLLLLFTITFLFGCSSKYSINSKEDIKKLKIESEQGIAASQYSLGSAYFYGWGVDEDKRKSEKLYLKAAEQGYIRAQRTLGNIYSSGNGVLMDKKKSIEFYLKAAEQDDSHSQLDVGMIYFYGTPGVKRDLELAKKWIKKSYENGNDYALKFWNEANLGN